MKAKKRVKIRKRWAINPRTRVKKSKKIYSRKRNKKPLTDGLESDSKG
jgi:hypothetical protein